MRSCDTETPGWPQHLAYQPLLPTINKYLQHKWDKASYDLHRMKVKSAKPTINMTPPETYGHLALRLKKQKLEEEWALKIQRENNILMEKISHIMRTTGGVDNRNYYVRKSLGKEKRQLELLRITKENQLILFRLSQCRPHYNVKSWHEDWLKTQKVMDSIARYPRRTAKQGQFKEQKTTTCCPETNGQAKSEETEKKETIKKQGKGEIQRDTNLDSVPEPCAPEKTSSSDSPENPGPSDTIQMKSDKHSVQQALTPDKSEMSNTPDMPVTYKLETTSVEEG